MIYRVLLFFVLFPVFLQAQNQKKYSDTLVTARINYFIYSSLGIEKTGVDLRTYNEFKNQFEWDAVAQDDYNIIYKYDSMDNRWTYNLNKQLKPFDEYAHDAALQIKSLFIDSVGLIQEVASQNKNMKTFSIFRRAIVSKERKYVLPNGFIDQVLAGRNLSVADRDSAKKFLKARISDTSTYRFTTSAIITINLIITDDSTVKIKSITSNPVEIVVHDDDDGDAVLNREDSLPKAAGDFTVNGMPDYDLDGVPDKANANYLADKCPKTFGSVNNQGCPSDYFLTDKAFEGILGLQMNSAELVLPELNNLGYRDGAGNDAMDVLQSKKGTNKSSGLSTGIYAAGNFTFYFGEKRKKGITFGVTYSGFNMDYEVTEPFVYTYKSNDGTNDYRRRVTMDSLTESIKYNVFQFPVLFNYRWFAGKKDKHPGKKGRSSFHLRAGPSLMIFNTSSEYNAFISFEGLYQSDANGITYVDPFVNESTFNIYITSDSIEAKNPDRNAEDVFDELRKANPGYDFADSKNFEGNTKNDTRLTVGLNLAFNMEFPLSKQWDLKVGAHGAYAPLPERKEKYVPLDKTTDPYQSIYDSNAKTSYSAFGIHAGLVYNF